MRAKRFSESEQLVELGSHQRTVHRSVKTSCNKSEFSTDLAQLVHIIKMLLNEARLKSERM